MCGRTDTPLLAADRIPAISASRAEALKWVGRGICRRRLSTARGAAVETRLPSPTGAGLILGPGTKHANMARITLNSLHMDSSLTGIPSTTAFETPLPTFCLD